MIPSKQGWEDLDKLVLVAGHAVYVGPGSVEHDDHEQWVLRSFQKGEPRYYIEHIRYGIELAASQPNSFLVFSGGQTRLEAGPRSEAQGYWLLADQFDWWHKTDVRDRAAAEEFARDSFENVLFGIARFRECTGHYPTTIEIVGWEFKRERFDFHRQTIRWPAAEQRYRYYGVNNPNNIKRAARGEAEVLATFKADPFGTNKELLAKRATRNPFQRQHPYATSCPEIRDLLNHTTTDGIAFTGVLPWDVYATHRGR